ncbi:hypothetical protein D8674_037421 [Pyrus ussuriensis x Pyrus communis]|uniref:Uncharacterized protein n=1 Tax=Pyrus ussuriensis x Pyrus communis TaxID=2448454 RepID=A0A5N5GW64_9ROSA|nr:hypothetical protein D8674_037421 [Pyrus ussuriensis x Pyrus communis]
MTRSLDMKHVQSKIEVKDDGAQMEDKINELGLTGESNDGAHDLRKPKFEKTRFASQAEVNKFSRIRFGESVSWDLDFVEKSAMLGGLLVIVDVEVRDLGPWIHCCG